MRPGMTYFTVKAIHLIGVVSWFAGLFYIPRIFIYSLEAYGRPEAERKVLLAQFEVMGRRLWYGITWPAMLITVVFGTWLVLLYDDWAQPWVWVKLGLVVSLIGYHLVCGVIRKQVVAGQTKWTSHRLRLWNEVATVILIASALVASLKNQALQWSVGASVVGVIFALTAGVYVYKKVRQRAGEAVES